MDSRKNRRLLAVALLCFVVSTACAWDDSKPKYYSVRGALLPDGSRKVINFDTWGSVEMYSTATVVGKNENSYSFGVVAPNSYYPQTGHSPAYQLIVTTQGYVGIATASPEGLFTVGNGTMTVTSAGSVGVGTASPGSLLDVNGTANLRGSSDGTGLYVNSNGLVGIGTTSPIRALHVNGELSISNSDKNALINVSDANGNGGGAIWLRGLDQNGAVGSTATVIICGNVGIGTTGTTPTVALAVDGYITGNGIFPDYTNGVSQSYNTVYQASSNGYLSVTYYGSYMNGIYIYVGSTSSPSTLIWEDGDDININTKSGSVLIPMKKGTYYKVTAGRYGYAYEYVTITFYPAD